MTKERKTFIIAEIGINHNGDVDIAKRIIDEAQAAGCDAVKFQKRTIKEVYTKDELDKDRESPWGTTNREQKNGLEFSESEYDVIDDYCKSVGIEWFASAWDIKSQKFLEKYNLQYNKISSPMLTHRKLLEMVALQKKKTFISTGMSSIEEISKAVKIFRDANCEFELMHCNSSYPMKVEDANLSCINTLKDVFGVSNVGYSGHEAGIIVSIAAVVLGATSIERHVTLDRAMYGSDQSASLEIVGLKKMVEYIRTIEKAIGDGNKVVCECELGAKNKLRIVDSL